MNGVRGVEEKLDERLDVLRIEGKKKRRTSSTS